MQGKQDKYLNKQRQSRCELHKQPVSLYDPIKLSRAKTVPHEAVKQ